MIPQRGLSVETKEALKQVRDDYLLVSLISTLQPVKAADILSHISDQELRERLEAAISRLLDDGRLLRQPNHTLLVASAGRKMFGSGPLAKERDVSRMFHLVAGGEEG